jgi:hypothetical protein
LAAFIVQEEALAGKFTGYLSTAFPKIPVRRKVLDAVSLQYGRTVIALLVFVSG